MTRRTIIISGILAITLFIVGFLSWGKILISILPELDGGSYQRLELFSGFTSCLLFGFTLALIPIGSVWLWKAGSIISTRKRMLSILVMVAGMIISVFLRRELIKFVTVPIDYNIQLNVPIEQVKFDFYALVGVILGGVVAWLLFREKKIPM